MHEPRFPVQEALRMPEALQGLQFSEAQMRMALAGLMSYEMKLSHEDYPYRHKKGAVAQSSDPDFRYNDEGRRVLGIVADLYRKDEAVKAYFDALAQERMVVLKAAQAKNVEAYNVEVKRKEAEAYKESIRSAILGLRDGGSTKDEVRDMLRVAFQEAYPSESKDQK